MQCYERMAMILTLYADAKALFPGLEFDPELLDDMLTDFGILRYADLIKLPNSLRAIIFRRISRYDGTHFEAIEASMVYR